MNILNHEIFPIYFLSYSFKLEEEVSPILEHIVFHCYCSTNLKVIELQIRLLFNLSHVKLL
jgi:hypothetical protein